MSTEIKSWSNLMLLEAKSLQYLKTKSLAKKETLTLLEQQLEQKQEILKIDLREKMTICKNNTENILKLRSEKLNHLKLNKEIHLQKLNMSIEIYKVRLSKLSKIYETIDTEKVTVYRSRLNKLYSRLKELNQIYNRHLLIDKYLNKFVKIYDIDFTLNYIVNSFIDSGLSFTKQDYNYFIKQIETK